MTEGDELAQRYLTLWTQYLTALLADPRAMETLNRWFAATGQFAYPKAEAAGQGDGMPFPTWPPFFGPFGMPPAPSPAAAEGDAAVAALARRVDALEQRLAALEREPEHPPSTSRARPRKRAGAG